MSKFKLKMVVSYNEMYKDDDDDVPNVEDDIKEWQVNLCNCPTHADMIVMISGILSESYIDGISFVPSGDYYNDVCKLLDVAIDVNLIKDGGNVNLKELLERLTEALKGIT